jgi:hypothetical protein
VFANVPRLIHKLPVTASEPLSILDRIVGQSVLVMAFGSGGLALLLDFTGWYTIVGAVLALVGCGYAVISPRGRVRKVALSLNAVAFALAALIYVALLL